MPLGPTVAFEFGGVPRFRVLRRLGVGSFGVVWLVRDLASGADVALKTLPAGRPDLVYRLKREFRALADLRHENLVSFYELFATEEECFFTMEYVPGETFLEYVRRDGGGGDGRLRAALAQLVRGLSALHQAGKLHRDIKPANVLVTEQGRLVLLDFGLATEIEESGLCRSAEAAGTPEYMSPEHALGQPPSMASDWYSVGVMLYEALTGQRPFRAVRTEPASEREPPSPAQVRPGVAPDLAELCRTLLHGVPERRPSAAEIAATLGSHEEGRGGWLVAPGDPPLIGREEELGTLHEALRSLRAGRGVTVFVEGSSGVGKTALVQHFLAQAERGESAVVLQGRCYERERVPYQGIDSLVDDLCHLLKRLDPAAVEALLPRHVSALVRLFPVLERVPSVAVQCRRSPSGSPDQQEFRRQAFGALRELLARASDRQPVVLHIDDLQWGDLDTAALIGEILRPPDAPSMLLILSFRSEDRERSPCLRSLAHRSTGEVVRLHVGPLTATAAEALARRLLGAQQDVDVARLAAEAGGNPLFVQELARLAALQGVGSATAGPPDLQTALRARIERLPSPARGLLEVVALAGYPIAEKMACRAAGVSGSAWEAWDLLRRGNLVRFAGGADERQVEPLHDRIREAVLSGLAPPRAVDCHRGLADALEEAGGADPEVLARHHEAAGRLDRARLLAMSAGEQAERALAFDRAARLFRWALDLAPNDHPERGRLLASLGGALANAGRGVEAAAAYLNSADLAAPGLRSDLRRQAAQQLLLGGNIDDGRELVTEDLRAAGFAIPKTPRRALALVLLRRVLIRLRGLGFRERAASEVPPRRLALMDHLWGVNRGLSMVEVVHGADFVSRYLLLALASGEPHRVALGLALEAGHAASVAPSSRRTRSLIERLERLDERLEDPRVHGHTLLVKGVRAYCSGNWPAALAHCDDSERTFREGCTGATWEIWTMRAFATWSLYQVGEWRELERRVHVQLGEARDRGNVYAMTVTRMPFGLMAWLMRGDVEGARRNAREAIASWSVQGFHLQHYLFLVAETLLDLHDGDGAAAWTRLRDRWPGLGRSLLLRIPHVRTAALHLRASCALTAAAAPSCGRTARQGLLHEAARALRRLSPGGPRTSPPVAKLLWAALLAQRGRSAEAVQMLEAAIAGLEHLQMRAYLAAARRRLAELRESPMPSVFIPGQEIADPAAMTSMLAPGFPPAGSGMRRAAETPTR